MPRPLPARALVVLAVAAALLLGPSPGRAQPATPVGPGVARGPLIRAVVPALPRGPALVVLVRLTYAPGASLTSPALPGPLVGVVERGRLAAQATGPVQVLPPVGAAASSAATPGGEPALGPGDQIVTLPGATVAYRNVGPAAASALVAGILPAGTPLPPAPAGVAIEPLAAGLAPALPRAPVLVTLDRGVLQPGGGLPEHREAGVTLVAMEGGALGVTVTAGQVQVTRAAAAATPAATPAAPEVATPGGAVVLGARDSAFFPLGAASSAAVVGNAPVSLLGLRLVPAPAAATAAVTPGG